MICERIVDGVPAAAHRSASAVHGKRNHKSREDDHRAEHRTPERRRGRHVDATHTAPRPGLGIRNSGVGPEGGPLKQDLRHRATPACGGFAHARQRNHRQRYLEAITKNLLRPDLNLA